VGQNSVRRERGQFGGMPPDVGSIGPGPADVDAQVVADGPARLTQRLQERPDAGLIFRIVRGCGQQHADVPHALALLRTRGERPRCRRAAKQRDELAPLHVCLRLRTRYCKSDEFPPPHVCTWGLGDGIVSAQTSPLIVPTWSLLRSHRYLRWVIRVVSACQRHVRYTPVSDRRADIAGCPFGADFVAEVGCWLARTVIPSL
jgi:hypothetical protein